MAVAEASTVTEALARQRVIDLVADLVERGEEVTVSVVRDFVRAMVDDEEEVEFRRSAAQGFAQETAAAITRGYLARQKRERRDGRERFNSWYEHVGEGRHKPFLELTGREIDFVQEERAPRLQTEIQDYVFRARVRLRVGDRQQVATALKPADLATLYSGCLDVGKAELDRIRKQRTEKER